jgi:T4 superinfection immunity protein
MTAILFIIFVFAMLVAFIVVYLLPTIIAGTRKHPYWGWIVFINIFTGWTIIGWLASLVWAIMNYHPMVTYVAPLSYDANLIGLEAVARELDR